MTKPTDHPEISELRVGVLLVNLGTPDRPETPAVKRYLKEFLSDRRVIDYPAWFWQPILRGIILNVRPKKTAAAYRKIWLTSEDESPLRYYTRQQAEEVQLRLGDRVLVDWAMNYGRPSIRSRLNELVRKGCRRILVLPLYPQYSAATTGSVCDRVASAVGDMNWQPAIRTLDTWHDDPAYVDAMAAHIRSHLESIPFRPEVLLMSFHGLPRRYLKQGDPYTCFCQKTGRLLAESLSDAGIRMMTTFQSRFGPEQWVKPYTDETVTALAGEGVRRVAIVAPGFVSDCIETLEELGIQLKETFVGAGGEDFTVIPCLNNEIPAIDMLETIVRRELSGWI